MSKRDKTLKLIEWFIPENYDGLSRSEQASLHILPLEAHDGVKVSNFKRGQLGKGQES